MVKKKYLITGASGFVGSCLLRRLVKEGKDVSIILRKQSKVWRIKDLLSEVKCFTADLTSQRKLEEIFKEVKPNVIYHLATYGAYSYQKEANKIFKVNILGSLNMINAADAFDYDLFVNTGTSSEYGLKDSVMREIDLLEPDSFYAISKSTQTLLSSYIATSSKKPIVTLRLFSVYGPYEEPTRLIPTLMRALMKKKEMDLVDPRVARDMIYIDDVVSVYLNVGTLSKHEGEYFNICSGIQSTVKDIVEIAMKVTGENTKFNWGVMENRSWDKHSWVGDNTKAKKLLGWTPKVYLSEGLVKMWKWYNKNHKIYEY